MSWGDYVKDMVTQDNMAEDAAIMCFTPGHESVWAAHKEWSNITPEEIQKLMNTDRNHVLTNGVMLAGERCRVVDDSMAVNGTMKLVTSETKRHVFIAKSHTAIVLAKGCDQVHAAQLIVRTTKIADHLSTHNM